MTTPTPAAALRAAAPAMLAVARGRPVELRCAALRAIVQDVAEAGEEAVARLVEVDGALDEEIGALVGEVDGLRRVVEGVAREKEALLKEVVAARTERDEARTECAVVREGGVRGVEALRREKERLESEVEGLRKLVEARERAFDVQVDIVKDLRRGLKAAKAVERGRELERRSGGTGILRETAVEAAEDGSEGTTSDEKAGLTNVEGTERKLSSEAIEDQNGCSEGGCCDLEAATAPELLRLRRAVERIGSDAKVSGGPPCFSAKEVAVIVSEHEQLTAKVEELSSSDAAIRRSYEEAVRNVQTNAAQRDEAREEISRLKRSVNKIEAEFRAVQKAHESANAELSAMRTRTGVRGGMGARRASGGLGLGDDHDRSKMRSSMGGSMGDDGDGDTSCGGRKGGLREAKGSSRRGQTAGRMPGPGRTETRNGSRIKNVLGSIENTVVTRVRQLSSSSNGSSRRG